MNSGFNPFGNNKVRSENKEIPRGHSDLRFGSLVGSRKQSIHNKGMSFEPEKDENNSDEKPRVSVKNLLSRFEQNAAISGGSQFANPHPHIPPVVNTENKSNRNLNYLSSPSTGKRPPVKPPKPTFLNQRVRSVTVTTSASPSFSQKEESTPTPSSTLFLQSPSLLKGNIHSKSTPNMNTFDQSSILDDYDVQSAVQITIPTPLVTSSDHQYAKIQMIKNEIFSTEVSYYSDLMILNDLYAQRLRNQEDIIPKTDWKLLFSGLHGIITTCYALIQSMITNSFVEPRNESYQYVKLSPTLLSYSSDLKFGLVFTQHIKQIEVTYSKYCKNNEAALLKVSEYSNHPETYPELKHFLNMTRMEMQGKTNAWDLASLLVKPFQRVLKYPLLFKRLSEALDPVADQDEWNDIKEATINLENVAEIINQVKKRKDVVEKYVQGKQSLNVMHGISKKWNRSTQMLKNVTGTSEAASHTDDFFEALLKHFEYLHQQLIPCLEKQINFWIKEVGEMIQKHLVFCNGLEAVYLDGSSRSRLRLSSGVIPSDSYNSVKEYRKLWDSIQSKLTRELQIKLKSILKALQILLDMFKSPLQIIKKRASKKLDHDRVAALTLRNEKIEKNDRASAEEYMDIHTQLCEDLPTFFHHVQEFIGIIAHELIQTQADFYKKVTDLIYPTYQKFYVEGYHASNHLGFTEGTRIRGDYEAAMAVGRDAYNTASDIKILSKWCLQVWGEDGRWKTDVTPPQVSTGLGFFNQSLGRKQEMSVTTTTKTLSRNLVQDVGENILIDVDEQESSVQYQQQPSVGSTLLVPTPYLPPNHFRVRVLYVFEAEMDEEVTIQPGEIVTVDGSVERNGSTEWWYGYVSGPMTGSVKQGWFPCNFVEIIN